MINVLATQPAGTKAIAEILFPTSVGLKYGGFIVERGNAAAGDPQLQSALRRGLPERPDLFGALREPDVAGCRVHVHHAGDHV